MATPAALVHVLTATAVLALTASFATAQVCSDEVVLNELGAGVPGPLLRAPDGAPVVGGPFSLRIEEAFPNSSGALVFSAVEAPFFDPTYGATFHFGVPYNTFFFATDSEGISPPKVVVPALDPSLCGAFVVFQAGVFDPGAMNGVAVTNALRFRVGVNAGPLLPLGWVFDNDRGNNWLSISLDTGDLDGDGVLDVVGADNDILSFDAFSVRISLGTSAGDFSPAAYRFVGTNPSTVRLADLNGDTNLDIVTSNFDTDDLSVLLGNGDGTFGAEARVGAGNGSIWVSIEDLDGDSTPDLVVANALSDDVSVLIGNGDGTFGAAVAVPVGNGPQEVAIGDVDGDTELDLVVVNYLSSDVSVLLGNGDGTFGAATNTPSPGRPISLGLGDFDGDGDLDLGVAHGLAGSTGVFLGNGDGTFGAATLYPGGPEPVSMLVEDIDGDSELDLAIATKGADRVTLLPGAGDGTFGPPTYVDVSGAPREITFADFDGDGDRDLGVAGDQWSVTYIRNRGDGTFDGPKHYVPGPDPWKLVIEDLDGDGSKDIVVGVSVSGQKASVLMGRGDGTFEDPAGVAIGLVSTDSQDLAVADFDGDGVLDLATAYANDLDVVLGNGDGTFGVPIASRGGGNSSLRLVAGRVDGDAFVDVIVGTSSDEPRIRLGNGDGTFGPEAALPNPCCNQVVGHEVALGDVDLDNLLDVVSLGRFGFSVYIGNGDGTFSSPTTYSFNGDPNVFALADLNEDGSLDVALGGEVLLNDGSGNFGPSIGTGSASFSLRVADLDGDGNPDQIVGSRLLQVLVGDGAGNFSPPATAFFAGYSAAIAVDDLDGDGIPDVVVSGYPADLTFIVPHPTPNYVTVLLNQLGE